MSIKINRLEAENVKRVRAVKVEPTPAGLTVVGGRNNQGKTSVLDAIAWALGGDKFRPSTPGREGSVVPPELHVVLSNGIVVERRGKNSDLRVLDPDGKKAGQQLLNEFVEHLALDLPRFMAASSKEKAETLLQLIGVGERLHELEGQENELYNQRHAIGQIADQKKKYFDEMAEYLDAPKDLISASELIRQQQDILTKNGENQRKRSNLAALEAQYAGLMGQWEELQKRISAVEEDLTIARKSAEDLQDESTVELEKNIADIEAVNLRVRANLDKEKAEEEAQQYGRQYTELTSQIESLRTEKMALLDGAALPLDGLSIQDGELTYEGFHWDNMSGSDQLKVATAIVRALNPKCGFVLLDKLEQMDVNTLREFGGWAESEGLQVIATRVSTGDECSIIIEDGYVAGAEESATQNEKWKEGEF